MLHPTTAMPGSLRLQFLQDLRQWAGRFEQQLHLHRQAILRRADLKESGRLNKYKLVFKVT